MAIFHCQVSVVSRGSGQSACASAAYCAGEKIKCDRLGITHDYTKKRGVDHSEILTPEINGKTFDTNRAHLWNKVESSEKRKDAQLARSIVVAIPIELERQSKIDLVREFVTENFVSQGMIADVNIHDINSHNPHAHILLTMRELVITPTGKIEFGNKNRDWNERALVDRQRQNWATTANKYLAQVGDSRIDHRSLADQGIERIPQIHIGVAASAMEKKGIRTERGDQHRQIAVANLEIAQAHAEIVTARQQTSVAKRPPGRVEQQRLFNRELGKIVIQSVFIPDRQTATPAEIQATKRQEARDQRAAQIQERKLQEARDQQEAASQETERQQEAIAKCQESERQQQESPLAKLTIAFQEMAAQSEPQATVDISKVIVNLLEPTANNDQINRQGIAKVISEMREYSRLYKTDKTPLNQLINTLEYTLNHPIVKVEDYEQLDGFIEPDLEIDSERFKVTTRRKAKTEDYDYGMSM